jgi:hypothetical protein
MSEHQENGLEEDEELRGSKKAGLTRDLGIVLLVAAILFWAAAPAVLLIPLSAAQKVWTGSAFLVLGREVFRRYRSFLDLRRWFGQKPR